MKKLLSILFISLLTLSSLQAEEKKQMSKEEFMKMIMQQEKDKNDAKAKTKAEQEKTKKIKEVRKASDKLVNMVGVDN